MWDARKGEAHFDASQCSGQHEIVEAAKMSDSEDFPLEFRKAGPKGQFWRTRADDMGVKAVRELLRRTPEIPPANRPTTQGSYR